MSKNKIAFIICGGLIGLLSIGAFVGSTESQNTQAGYVFRKQYVSDIKAVTHYFKSDIVYSLAQVICNLSRDTIAKNHDYYTSVVDEYVVYEEVTTHYTFDPDTWHSDVNVDTLDDYIELYTYTTTNKEEAITSIIGTISDEQNPQNKPFIKQVSYKGNIYDVTYYPVGMHYYERYEDDLEYDACGDMNYSAGGDYVYLYYAKDLRIGNPITYIHTQYEDKDGGTPHHVVGKRNYVKDQNGNDIDLNSDTNSDFVYLYYYVDGDCGFTVTYKIAGFGEFVQPNQFRMPEFESTWQHEMPGFGVQWYLKETRNPEDIPSFGGELTNDITLFGRVICYRTKTDEECATTFKNKFLKMDLIETTDPGRGDCSSKGWYALAKEFLVEALVDDIRQYIFSDADAYARLQAWAIANGETIVLTSNGSIEVSNLSNNSLVLNSNESSFVISILFIAVGFVVVTLFFVSKKRHSYK